MSKSSELTNQTTEHGLINLGEEQIEQAAEVVEKTSDWFVTFFENFFAGLTVDNILFQIAVVVLSVLAGVFLGGRFATNLKRRQDSLQEEKGFVARFRHLYLGLIANVSFSLVAGLCATLLAFALTLFGYPAKTLIVCRIAYNLFFAYALLCLLLAFFQLIIGRNVITQAFQRGVSILFWIFAALQFFGVLDHWIAFLDNTLIPMGESGMSVWRLLMAMVTVLLTLGIANWISEMVEALVVETENIAENLKMVLKRLIRVFFMVIAIIVGLSTVGIDLTILSVFGGAVGVGLGFGLQKIASNYVSGFIILLDKSVKIGDMVNVDGFTGKVTEINTRFTVVRSTDGIENIVPNENFVTNTVQNYSYQEQATIQTLVVSIAYEADIRKAMKIMLEEGMKDRPRIVKGRKGWVTIDCLAASSIDLKLGFWVEDAVNGVGGLRTQITLDIIDRFNAEGIVIPYSILEVNLHTQEPVKFELQDGELVSKREIRK